MFSLTRPSPEAFVYTLYCSRGRYIRVYMRCVPCCLTSATVTTELLSSLCPSHQRIWTGGLLEVVEQLKLTSCPSMAVEEPNSITFVGSTDAQMQRHVSRSIAPRTALSTFNSHLFWLQRVFLDVKRGVVSGVSSKITLSGSLFSLELSLEVFKCP